MHESGVLTNGQMKKDAAAQKKTFFSRLGQLSFSVFGNFGGKHSFRNMVWPLRSIAPHVAFRPRCAGCHLVHELCFAPTATWQ
jgi:hypothetical protein